MNRAKGESHRLLIVALYAVAMAWVESAVVYYLRTLVDRIDPPRFFSLVGWARLHHCHYKSTIYYTETSQSDYPFPFKVAKQRLVDEFDRRYLEALLEAHDNNISAAARAAGIERMSIYKMIRRLGLDKENEDSDKRPPTADEDIDERDTGHSH